MKQKEEKNPGSEPVYGHFAAIYDRFTAHVPYKRWARYLCDHARRRFDSIPGRVLDLGCGTGSLLEALGLWVSELHGLDASEEMLALARGRLGEGDFRAGRIQDALPYERGSFGWIICSHDTLNYLAEPDDLRAHFREVARVLEKGGLYSTEAVSLKNIMENHAGRTRTLRLAPYKIVVTRRFDRESNILTTEIRFLNGADGEFVASEVHRERYYHSGEIIAAAKGAGLELHAREGNYTFGPPGRGDDSMNFHFVK